ncbi:MAG: hypothetical protein ACYCYL_04955 [Acidithiobacillus sp.]
MKPVATTWLSYYAGYTEEPADELLDIGFLNQEYRSHPFAYPMDNGQIKHFASVEQWYDYVQSLRIKPHQVTLPYVDAFDEALRVLFMTYIIPEFCKMAETKAFATLEGALKEAYHHKTCKTVSNKIHRRAGLADCLEWAEKNDGLTPDLFDKTIGQRRPEALNVIRDKQMHGKFEEMFPWGGLFEVIKETIEYAFRNLEEYDIHQLRAHNILLRMDSSGPDVDMGSSSL